MNNTLKKYTGIICRGSWSLGTACGHCEKCLDTKPTDKESLTVEKGKGPHILTTREAYEEASESGDIKAIQSLCLEYVDAMERQVHMQIKQLDDKELLLDKIEKLEAELAKLAHYEDNVVASFSGVAKHNPVKYNFDIDGAYIHETHCMLEDGETYTITIKKKD